MSFWKRWEARDVAPFITLLALVIFFSIVTRGSFLRMSTLQLILSQGAVWAIAAAGMTFVLLCGEIDLAVGNLAIFTGCFCGWLLDHWAHGNGAGAHAGIVLASTLIPILASVALGTLSGTLVVWSRLPSFIITLAMMNIAVGLSQWMTEGRTLPVPKLLYNLGNHGLELKNLGQPFTLPYIALIAAAVMIVGHLVLQHTHFGRYVYMTGGNRQAARLAGIRCGWVVTCCLAITAFTGALAGLLAAGRIGSVSLGQNQDLLLTSVACVVLGGTSLFGGEGGMGKTLLGVLTYMVLYQGLNMWNTLNDHARQLLMGVVLLGSLVLNGLLAKRSAA